MDSRSVIGDHEDDGAVIPGGLRVPLTVAVHHMMSLMVTIIMSFVKCKDCERSGSVGVLITMDTDDCDSPALHLHTGLPHTWGSSV